MTPRITDAPDEHDQIFLFARVHPGGRLVEQQQFRLAGQRAGDFEPALKAVGEIVRVVVGVFFESTKRSILARAFAYAPFLGALARRCSSESNRLARACARARPVMTFSSADMNANSRMFWNVRAMPDLATASIAAPGDVAAVELDAPFGRRVHAGDQIEHRRFAGPVGADHGRDRPARHFEGQVLDRDQAAEAFRDALEAQERMLHRLEVVDRVQVDLVAHGGVAWL